jgi:hypothetical protein
LVPENVEDPKEIPPTIIFVNNKQNALQISQTLQRRLPNALQVRPPLPTDVQAGHDVRSQAEKIIAMFYADHSQTLKQLTFEQFQSGECRILVATDAFGVGMDIINIQRVIQWGVAGLDNIDTLIQRFGRCARDQSVQGMCILYYEQSYFGSRSENNASQQSQPAQRKRTKQPPPSGDTSHSTTKRSARDMRDAMEEVLWRFINDIDQGCRRVHILEYYADPARSSAEPLASGPCCDLDSEDQINEYPCGYKCPEFPRGLVGDQPQIKTQSGQAKPKPPTEQQKNSLQQALLHWRQEVYRKDWKAKGLFMPSWVISDKSINAIIANCTRIDNITSLFSIPGFSWDTGHTAKYGMCVNTTVRYLITYLE